MAKPAIVFTVGRKLAYKERLTNAKLNQVICALAMTFPNANVVRQYLESDDAGYQELTGAGAVSLTTALTRLNNPLAGPYAVTIGAGSYVGQGKLILRYGAIGNPDVWNLTGTFYEGWTTLTFDTRGGSAHLWWDGLAWHLVGGSATGHS